jgi:tetratricopeptide (TPR) repeat protein
MPSPSVAGEANFTLATGAGVEIALTVVTDFNILLPELVHLDLTRENFIAAVNYSGDDAANTTFDTFLANQSYSLGDAVPYIVMSFDTAVRRVLNNAIYSDHHIVMLRKSLEAIGVNRIDRNLKNVGKAKPLLGLTPLPKRIPVTFKVFSNRLVFDAEVQRVGLHHAEAYYDAQTGQIGLFIDLRLFRWIGYQAGWKDRDVRYGVQLTQGYLNRIMIAKISHEIYHLFQAHSKSIVFNNPLINEGSAIVVQSNIAFRDEFNRLTRVYTARGLKPEWPGSGNPHFCDQLLQIRLPLGNFGAGVILRGARTLVEDKQSIVSVLRLRAVELNTLPKERQRDFYDIGALLVYYLWTELIQDRSEIFNSVEALVKSGDLTKLPKDLDARINDFAQAVIQQFTGQSLSGKAYEILNASSYCMSQERFLSAHSGAELAVMFEAARPTAYLYLGDLFWRLGEPLIALEYYSQARQSLRVTSNPIETFRVESRLGDAYEYLGDLESALKHYERTIMMDVGGNEGLQIVRLRSLLKRTFYLGIKDRDMWRTEKGLFDLNTLVNRLYNEMQTKSSVWPYSLNDPIFVSSLETTINTMVTDYITNLDRALEIDF